MAEVQRTKIIVALAGNPNCGKTTIFNTLTGEKQAVGNYSGVTVEKVEGHLTRNNVEYQLVDLPGVYSLNTFSKDERVARDFLLHEQPDVIVNVIDASNLERNLFLTLQLKELGLPLILVFNMCDLAKSRGIVYNLDQLKTTLDLPILEAVGTTGEGLEGLLDLALEVAREATSKKTLYFSEEVETEIARVVRALDIAAQKEGDVPVQGSFPLGVEWLMSAVFDKESSNDRRVSYSSIKDDKAVISKKRWLAIKLLENDEIAQNSWRDPELIKTVDDSIERLRNSNVPMAAKFAAERYAIVRKICKDSVRNEKDSRVLWSDRADRILTHPIWGLGIFFIAMYLVFWLTFALGNYPVSWLENLFDYLSALCNRIWSNSPDSLLRSVLVDGVIGGVGGVLTFFPNIFILFMAISFLEESGYMARGAFLTDRFLRRFGLTGKSFIPMLVGFGCSIPAVMSTRIIEDRKSRLSTIFVVPLMSCGARFPIYMLIIPAFFPEKWQAPVLWCVYFAGIVIAAIISSILSATTFRNEHNPLLIELPSYHAPTLNTVGKRALERGWQYLKKAGTTILGVSLVLWAASTFPMIPQSNLEPFEQRESLLLARADALKIDLNNFDAKEEKAEDFEKRPDGINDLLNEWENVQNEKIEAALEYSFMGRVGKACEPITKLAGFDWRIGTALLGALAAKEVFVAQLGIVFKVGEADENSRTLRSAFAENYPPLVGICVIIFCLIGAPCLATLVIVAKEATFRWAITQWITLTTTGFILAVVVYQLGNFFQFGM
ncbi:MAG: ferrous iron transport protein B [Thermoguttaceae bacterium]|nr:ferrous iron transport protein B [Thermoguttaceae bacterium]